MTQDTHPAPPRVLILLAPGAEEMEVVIVADVLRRAGCEVVLAGLHSAEPVRCSRGVVIVPDQALSDVDGPVEAIVLPGGMGGTERMEQSAEVAEWLRTALDQDLWVGAICAAPRVLVSHGYFGGRTMTSHPAVRDAVAAGAIYTEARVALDGRLITSRGPGTAFDFALKLVEKLLGEARVQEVAGPMLLEF